MGRELKEFDKLCQIKCHSLTVCELKPGNPLKKKAEFLKG